MRDFLKHIKWKTLLARTGIVIGVTVLMAVFALFSVLLIINYGPSRRAHKVFVKSVRETSAIGFLGDWFTTKEELASIIAENSIEEITDIIKENSIGFTKAMEVLTVIDTSDHQKCYMFYRKVEEMKE